MRKKTHRTAFRLGLSASAFGCALLAAPAAMAQPPNLSQGSAPLAYAATQGLDTDIATEWKGPSSVQVRAVVKMDPVGGAPLVKIDMPKGALLEAVWDKDKLLHLTTKTGSVTDGMFVARHTLNPSVEVKVNFLGLNSTFSFSVAKLINKIPGAKFNFDVRGQKNFAPWGFEEFEVAPVAPILDYSKLFDVEFSDFPSIIASNMDGRMAAYASTRAAFDYKTDSVEVVGASGPLAPGAVATLPAEDADFMDIPVNVKGTLKVKGQLEFRAEVELKRVLARTGNWDFKIDKGIDTPYFADIPVNFPSVTVHLPLPNVKVPKKNINLGQVKDGGSATKTIKVDNSGEKEALVSFASTDGAFKVPEGEVAIPPKGSYELRVRINSSGAPAQSEIRVVSNDPDSPEQLFKMGINGADLGPDTEDGSLDGEGDGRDRDGLGGLDDPNAGAGCGCSTPGTSHVPPWAAMGALGIACALVGARRRRRAAGPRTEA